MAIAWNATKIFIVVILGIALGLKIVSELFFKGQEPDDDDNFDDLGT